VRTFLGKGTLGLLMWSRVYDEWVHRHDLRRALGLPDEDVDLDSPSEFVLAAIAVNTVPSVAGVRGDVVVALRDTPVAAWRYGLGSGASGPDRGGDGAAATISAPAPAFIMAAAGRDRFDELMASGVLAVDGDEKVARAFLAALRIV
jgi:hypothetical protein